MCAPAGQPFSEETMATTTTTTTTTTTQPRSGAQMGAIPTSAARATQAARAVAGKSFPLGASVTEGGVNFSVFSRHASGMQVVLFDREEDARPSRVIDIDPI